jgi:hypothetical protein
VITQVPPPIPEREECLQLVHSKIYRHMQSAEGRYQSGYDGEGNFYLPPKRPPFRLKPRPQLFVFTMLSLYKPPPTPAAGPVGGCFAVLGSASTGSSKP